MKLKSIAVCCICLIFLLAFSYLYVSPKSIILDSFSKAETASAPTASNASISSKPDVKAEIQKANDKPFSNIEISLPSGLILESVGTLVVDGKEIDSSSTKVSFDSYDSHGNIPETELIVTGSLITTGIVKFYQDDVRGDYYLFEPDPAIQFAKKSLMNEYFSGFYISPELAKKIYPHRMSDEHYKVKIKKVNVVIWFNDTKGSYIADDDLEIVD